MEPINNYVEVDYELFVPNEAGNMDLVEKTSKENPFSLPASPRAFLLLTASRPICSAS